MLKELVEEKGQGSQQKLHLIHTVALDFKPLKSALGEDSLCAVGGTLHFPGSRE